MLSVDDALQKVLSRVAARAPGVRPTGEALGLVLAEDVVSDVDSPPHDKSVVDGYAVVAADLANESAQFEVLEEVTAGAVPTKIVTRGHATRIMTGAPLPHGADAVVMIEYCDAPTTTAEGAQVRVSGAKTVAGQNIMRRAASMVRGDVVLRAGSLIRPIELGVLAEVGRVEVRVVEPPTVAVLPTGNELVRPTDIPAAGQIRNSNGPMLVAAAQAAGAVAHDLGIATDRVEVLREAIARGLERDVLLISGGVSAGVLDLVPGVLQALGVEQVFHKVNVRPGKPLWFGVLARAERQTLVFGLPGNPVSGLVCFELFVRPAIARLSGRGDKSLSELQAPLASDFSNRSNRPTYFPAKLTTIDGQTVIQPLRWQGSADLRSLVEANALAYIPPGPREFRAGQMLRVLRLPEVP